MKRILKMISLVLVVSMMLCACGKSQTPVAESSKPADTPAAAEGGESADAPAAAESNEPAAEPLRVAFITWEAQGDNGFCDSCVSGVKRIAEEFGCEYTILEAAGDTSKYTQMVDTCFQWGPDVVFASPNGFEEQLCKYADENPDIKIINIDTVLDNPNKTISSVQFVQEEGSFMAGVVAALVTEGNLEYSNEEKIVGAIGGNDIAVIRSFIHGYEQGVAYVNPEIKVETSFLGDFMDPVLGKQAANQLYAKGCDIVYQIAGVSGDGVLEAAGENQKYAIGVNSNQNGNVPGYVVTSMVKDCGGAIYDIFCKIQDGTYEDGSHYRNYYGEGGTYIAIDEYTESILTPEMMDFVKETEEKLKSGEIKVELYPEFWVE